MRLPWCFRIIIQFTIWVTHEYALEFFKTENSIAFDIMFLDHICNFVFRNVLAKLLHSEVDVLLSYEARTVRIELLEDGCHFLFSHESTYINCRGEELTIVNLTISMVVNFLDHLLDFFCRHA